ncbi:Transposable element Tc1 transposase [Araneus ventricosus]|uniref:Transposable element Tc1 transposase n=1 Tax=Araneus ventricosus TaxID=182803 RepID=A0A4Y2AN12_ARAVE|nr:Transposable element Tc1 transposase [Araneus ventricosus]
MVDKEISFWQSVIFADEAKFNIFGSDGRITVWRNLNEELNPKNLLPTVKHGGGGIMVWEFFAASGMGNLIFIENNMDQYKYINILKENLKISAQKLGIQNTFRLYQDNDPKHTALNVRLWLLYNCPKVIKTPLYSLDLNTIENAWHKLEKRTGKHATRVLFRDRPRNFEPLSDVEDNTRTGTPSCALACSRPHTRQIASGIGFRTWDPPSPKLCPYHWAFGAPIIYRSILVPPVGLGDVTFPVVNVRKK